MGNTLLADYIFKTLFWSLQKLPCSSGIPVRHSCVLFNRTGRKKSKSVKWMTLLSVAYSCLESFWVQWSWVPLQVFLCAGLYMSLCTSTRGSAELGSCYSPFHLSWSEACSCRPSATATALWEWTCQWKAGAKEECSLCPFKLRSNKTSLLSSVLHFITSKPSSSGLHITAHNSSSKASW